ncbi:zinc-dependent alcohol dehydrogenase [Actinophytocola sp.]|uniref:zinc-dependent alcohol dehydrogenase n=1 Tax=Actinophytocola sp. TaxID=1872138 RepID=UPI002ED11389
MWALRQPAPFEIERIEVPAPDPGELAPDEVLVRFRLGGICGSDLPAFSGVRNLENPHTGRVGAPLHEIVGDVVASAANRLRVGDRVVGTAWPVGLQELITVPADQLHVLSPDLTDMAAIMMQPLATVLCALDRIGDVAGRHAAVLGLGPMGVLFCVVLRARGAHVTGVDRVDRADVVKTFGIDQLIVGQTHEWVMGLTDADRPDLVIDAIGHSQDVLADCVAAASPHGEIYAFGLPEEHYVLPMRVFFRKALTLRGGVTSNWPAHLAAAEQFVLLRQDLASAYVTHSFPLTEARDAFLTALRPSAGRLKIALTLPN